MKGIARNWNVEGYMDPQETLQEKDEVWSAINISRLQRAVLQAEPFGVETITDPDTGKREPQLILRPLPNDDLRILIPYRESGLPQQEDIQPAVAYRRMNRLMDLPSVAFVVLGTDHENNIAMGSRKIALERMAHRTWEELKPQAIVKGVVHRVFPNAAIVDIGGIEARMQRRQAGYGTASLTDTLTVGQLIEAQVIAVDRDKGIVSLSQRVLETDPWQTADKRYFTGQTYSAYVTNVQPYGIFAELEPGIDIRLEGRIGTVGKIREGQKAVFVLHRLDVQNRRASGRILRVIDQV